MLLLFKKKRISKKQKAFEIKLYEKQTNDLVFLLNKK